MHGSIPVLKFQKSPLPLFSKEGTMPPFKKRDVRRDVTIQCHYGNETSYNTDMKKEKAIAEILRYHERTKHRQDRFAPGPGHMDWANEPVPFRFYENALTIRHPLLERDPEAAYVSLYKRSDSMPLPFTVTNVASMLELSMGLSAWKSYQGNTWALRMNPSSGNLHPTESYLVLPPLQERDNQGGVFHYNPYFHGLEQRATFEGEFWKEIRDHFGTDLFFIGLSSIHWRESWKYGERAFRYCNHDVGHAVACLGFSANLHGWKVLWLSALADRDIETMLGFDRTSWHAFEKEYPDLLLLVHNHKEKPKVFDIPPEIVSSFSSLSVKGSPNRLSKEHADWKIIEAVASATEKPRSPEPVINWNNSAYLIQSPVRPSAATIIRQRRSAQVFDAETAASRDVFFAVLDKTIPRQGCAPFDAGLGGVSVHLAVFVHRVTDLAQGLYMLVREHTALEDLKQKCRKEFLWQKAEGTPGALDLYLLERGDYREIAASISCHQDIAGDSAFSLGMIAKFRENIEKEPWLYRRLFWETGMIGQVLYLEAEAHGLRGTGMGCFFDDMMHRLLGLNDDSYQSLYHFTIGGALEDTRITTLPPYHHLEPQTGKNQ